MPNNNKKIRLPLTRVLIPISWFSQETMLLQYQSKLRSMFLMMSAELSTCHSTHTQTVTALQENGVAKVLWTKTNQSEDNSAVQNNSLEQPSFLLSSMKLSSRLMPHLKNAETPMAWDRNSHTADGEHADTWTRQTLKPPETTVELMTNSSNAVTPMIIARNMKPGTTLTAEPANLWDHRMC